MICVNDDQPDGIGEDKRQETKERFANWMEGKWGGEGHWDEWEREDASWVARISVKGKSVYFSQSM